MKRWIVGVLLMLGTIVMAQEKENAIELSQDLFAEFKMGYDLSETKKALESYPYDQLVKELDTDAKKKAFWLNIYNVFGQIQLNANPDAYKFRAKFFRDKFIVVAGVKLNLNKIEHGILRKSQWTYGFGYFPKPFPRRSEKALRVEALDPRIHFALNCGAISCPPIYVYEPGKIDEQLELAAAGFLEMETKFNKETNEVGVSRLFLWYKGDFGGKKGTMEILKKHNLIGENESPKIKYRKYDWTLHLKNMKE